MVGRVQAESQCEAAALGKASEDRGAPLEPERRALFVDERVELGERGCELLLDRGVVAVRGEQVVPHVSGCPRRVHRRARQHDREMPVGIEIRKEAAQVDLVGTVPVEEQEQALRRRSLDDVRDQRHAPENSDDAFRPGPGAAAVAPTVRARVCARRQPARGA